MIAWFGEFVGGNWARGREREGWVGDIGGGEDGGGEMRDGG